GPMSYRSGGGGQDLVEDGLRLGVVGVLGQRQFADEDLPRLGQHPLLTGGQAALLIAAPQVANHLGDLVDVARSQLLEVGLVPARPVGRLFGVWGAKYLENLVEALLTDDVAHPDVLRILGRHSNRQVPLGNLQDEVFLLFAFDGPGFDRLDQRSTVVGINNG